MDSGQPVVHGAGPVPGAVCATRRSRIPDKQRAPRSARQRSWIPNQHGCAWERGKSAGGQPPADSLLAVQHQQSYCGLSGYTCKVLRQTRSSMRIFLGVCVCVLTF
mmetsp:Transcript_45020/g.37929  ORF Transcript_45020/g.37929 Transcript_45020/m.37929 type:complete len:106 (+) Transcript_45020:448-765(+)